MFEAQLDCYSCHAGVGGKIVRSTSCQNCHEEGYDELLTEWQESIKIMLTAIDGILQNIDRNAIDDALRGQLQELEMIVDAVHEDGSFGVHNYIAIDELLTHVKDKLEQMY